MTFERVSESGSYSGNGTSQTITLPWNAALVFICSSNTSTNANKGGGVKIDAMPSAAFYRLRQVNNGNAEYLYVTANGITLGTADFSVGSDTRINASGVTYYWFAIKAGPWIQTGSYAGAQLAAVNTAQSIAIGRTCERSLIIVAQANTTISQIAFRLGQLANGAAWFLLSGGTAGFVSTGLSWTSTGFDVTNEGVADLNTLLETYYYAVLFESPGGSRTQASFGSTFLGQSRADSGSAVTDNVITTGQNTTFVMKHGAGSRLYFSFDPMAARGALFCGTNDCVFATSTVVPQRDSTGYHSGTDVGTSWAAHLMHY